MTNAEEMLLQDALKCAIESNKKLCAIKVGCVVQTVVIVVLMGIIAWIKVF